MNQILHPDFGHSYTQDYTRQATDAQRGADQHSSPELTPVATQAIIDPTRLVTRRQLPEGAIAPASEQVEFNLAGEHKADPIKSLDDINRISQYLISSGRYRDNMLFICGINFGLRISDLLRLRFCHLINDDLSFKDEFPILEKKTEHTRKTKKNRWLTVNDAVIDAVTLYLQHAQAKLDDFMFRSESPNGKEKNVALSRKSIDRILKEIQSTLGISAHMSSHTLRKTFGYHQMAMDNNDSRKLLVLQKMFGHSSASQTMEYIGITDEEINSAYLKLNLGGKHDYASAYARFNHIREVG